MSRPPFVAGVDHCSVVATTTSAVGVCLVSGCGCGSEFGREGSEGSEGRGGTAAARRADGGAAVGETPATTADLDHPHGTGGRYGVRTTVVVPLYIRRRRE